MKRRVTDIRVSAEELGAQLSKLPLTEIYEVFCGLQKGLAKTAAEYSNPIISNKIRCVEAHIGTTLRYLYTAGEHERMNPGTVHHKKITYTFSQSNQIYWD